MNMSCRERQTDKLTNRHENPKAERQRMPLFQAHTAASSSPRHVPRTLPSRAQRAEDGASRQGAPEKRRPELPGEGQPVNPPASHRTATQRAKTGSYPHRAPGEQVARTPDPVWSPGPLLDIGVPAVLLLADRNTGEPLAAADRAGVLGRQDRRHPFGAQAGCCCLGVNHLPGKSGAHLNPHPPTPGQKFAQDALAWVTKQAGAQGSCLSCVTRALETAPP